MSSTYDPEVYDLVTPADLGGDVHWYRELAVSSGGPVLELGAGTGRITLEIARSGIDIVGLDSNSDMLARLTEKAERLQPELRSCVTTSEADMASFRLDRQFKLIIAPFRAFLHNLTPEAQVACVRSVFEHLLPGGTFALNVFHPSLSFMAQNTGHLEGIWRLNGEWSLNDGGFLIRSEANAYDSVKRIVHSRHRYERFDASGKLTSVFIQRLELAYLYPEDLKRLLQDAGFVGYSLLGGFDGRTFSADGDELVVQATRP